MLDYSTSEEIHLVSRPKGVPDASCFKQVRRPLPPLAPGEVRVLNEFISVDPYMRGRMNDGESYVEPFRLGHVMEGDAIGRVVESRSDGLTVGDRVTHYLGWRDVAQGPAHEFTKVTDDTVDPKLHLSILGITGFTAYVGLIAIANLRAGETVFVSGAAGAVGSAAGQLARLLGAGRVIGSAGNADKVRWLIEKAGFDAAFDYHDGDPLEQLGRLAPDGIDVFFDNVGGPQLEAAIEAMNDFGRAAICGSISNYNTDERSAGPRNLGQLINRSLTLRGFIVTNHRDMWDSFRTAVSAWVRSGDISVEHTVVDGMGHAVEAFLGLFDGTNLGKMLVQPHPDRL
ncbi:NADP-dependent oxidoreductase [Mycolicibacterium sp.]|uniref:NADP-dependent oxidoreductase n=1 Tax=Mycolicibacterium sp. TaxID=2320850 RepID=UPI0037C718F6